MNRAHERARLQLERGVGERLSQDAVPGAVAGWEGPAVFLLAIATFLLVASISLWQAAYPGRATVILRNAVVATTEIDVVLREHLNELKHSAQSDQADLVSVPGYPVEVYFSRDEAMELDEPAIRDLLLRRSASVVYAEGLKAFDRTGNQELGFFSVQGQMDLAITTLTADTHAWASWAVAIFGLVVAALAVAVLASAEGYSGFVKLGIAVAVGSGFGLFVAGCVWMGAGWIGGNDPFVADLRDIVRSVLAILVRNYFVVTVAGGLVAVVGPLAGALARSANPDDDRACVEEPPTELTS